MLYKIVLMSISVHKTIVRQQSNHFLNYFVWTSLFSWIKVNESWSTCRRLSKECISEGVEHSAIHTRTENDRLCRLIFMANHIGAIAKKAHMAQSSVQSDGNITNILDSTSVIKSLEPSHLFEQVNIRNLIMIIWKSTRVRLSHTWGTFGFMIHMTRDGRFFDDHHGMYKCSKKSWAPQLSYPMVKTHMIF
jgi:hypothetical protein